jgi:hypothetical protein
MQFQFNNRSPGNPTRRGLFDAYASWGRARDIDHELAVKLRETRQRQ